MVSTAFAPNIMAPPATEEPSALKTPNLLRLLTRRRRIIVVTLAALVGITVLYLALATPMYSSEVTLQVASYEMTAENIGDPTPPRPQDETRIATQLELLGGGPLGHAVVRQLDLVDDPEFSAPTLLHRLKSLFRIDPPKREANEDAQEVKEAAAVERLFDHVTISRVALSHEITLTAKSRDPRKALRIAAAFAQLHIQRLRDAKKLATEHTIQSLAAQVDDLRQQATSGEHAAAAYGSARALVGSPGQASEIGSIDFLTNQLAQARAARVEAEARHNQFVASGGGGAEPSGSASSPLLADLRAQQAVLDKRLAELQARFGAGYPDVISVQAQRDEIAAHLTEERNRVQRGLAGEVAVDRAREAQLEGEVSTMRSRALANREAGVGLGDLQSGAETTRAQYQAQLTRLQQLRGRDGKLDVEVSVASKPLLPIVPSDPKPMRLLAAAVVAGLILGIILAVIADLMDDRVRTGEQVAELLGVETLSMVPELKGEDAATAPQTLLLDQPTSLFSESIRGLFLELAGAGRGKAACIVVVSPLPGEGKTTIAVGLAAAAATLGMHPVLVDLDLRRPSVHTIMGRPVQRPDIIAYLTGEATIEEVTHSDEAMPNLFSISVASAPRDPGRLLTSPAIGRLIDALRDRHDVIIVNAPPVLPVRDARLLSAFADATLMVLRWGHSRRDAVRVAGKMMHGAITASVINRVDYSRHAAAAYGDQLQHYHDYSSYFGAATPPAPAAKWSLRNLFRLPRSGRTA